MLDTIHTTTPPALLATLPPAAAPVQTLKICALFAKIKGGESYRVELKYKHGDKFILRPISGKPYQWITATAEQLRDKKLFSLRPHFMLV